MRCDETNRNYCQIISGCGVANSKQRIVGGQEAQPRAYPWIGMMVDAVRNALVCSVSLITDRHALTTALCVEHANLAALSIIFLAHDRFDASEPERIYANVAKFIHLYLTFC